MLYYRGVLELLYVEITVLGLPRMGEPSHTHRNNQFFILLSIFPTFRKGESKSADFTRASRMFRMTRRRDRREYGRLERSVLPSGCGRRESVFLRPICISSDSDICEGLPPVSPISWRRTHEIQYWYRYRYRYRYLTRL